MREDGVFGFDVEPVGVEGFGVDEFAVFSGLAVALAPGGVKNVPLAVDEYGIPSMI